MNKTEIEIEEDAIDGDSWDEAEETTDLTFGMAIDRLLRGMKVCRSGWNGKGMFLFMVGEGVMEHPAIGSMTAVAYIAMKSAQNTVHPWNASQADALANDWMVVE